MKIFKVSVIISLILGVMWGNELIRHYYIYPMLSGYFTLYIIKLISFLVKREPDYNEEIESN